MYHIQRFCLEHPDNWKKLLTSAPYNLRVRHKDGLVLFMYNYIGSKFSYELVREARGIIFEEETFKPVCVGFNKFFNIQEKHAYPLKWKDVTVEEKIDGSIIKAYFYNGKLRFATNGTIDASDADLSFPTKDITNYYELIMVALGDKIEILKKADQDYTYIFEIVSPHNRVLVPHKEIDIYHIGTRHVESGIEKTVSLGFKTPRTYEFQSLDELLGTAEKLDYTREGFVLRDHNFNRVKAKSIAYVKMHRCMGAGNGTPSNRNIMEMIICGVVDDFMSVFPEYNETTEDLLERFNTLLMLVSKDVNKFEQHKHREQKDYAINFANKCAVPSLMYGLYRGKVDIAEWEKHLRRIKPQRMLNILEDNFDRIQQYVENQNHGRSN